MPATLIGGLDLFVSDSILVFSPALACSTAQTVGDDLKALSHASVRPGFEY
jgi:hypothetical protein